MDMKSCLIYALLSLLLLPCDVHARDVHVATDGSDSNPGTVEAPFRTIGRATSVMRSGDRCLIHAGIYRETIAPKADNLHFGPHRDARVEINGCDVVAGPWKKGEKGIQVTPIPEKVWQVFVDGKQMSVARYPDAGDESTLLTTDRKRWAKTEVVLPTDPVLSSVRFPVPKHFPDGWWKGTETVYSGMHGQNPFTACSGQIQGVKEGILQVRATGAARWFSKDSTTFFGPGTGYIMNCLAALDAPGEWVWSPKDRRLYLFPPAGDKLPNRTVEVRRRLWGLDLRGRKNVKVERLRFRAASIRLDDAEQCVVRNCAVQYPSPWSNHKTTQYGGRVDASCGVYVSGSKNLLHRLQISKSWGAGVRIEGQDNTMDQCLVEDICWLGRRMAGVQAWGLRNHILRNVVRRCGNNGIDGGQRGFGVGKFGMETDIRYNLVLDAGCLASFDTGHFYVNTQGYPELLKTIVAYNTFLRFGGVNFNKHAGHSIYTDNGTRGVIAHHNVSDLPFYHRPKTGDVEVVFRGNQKSPNGKAPEPTDEGIRELLGSEKHCPPIDAKAQFDREVPNPRKAKADNKQKRELLILNDAIALSYDEILKRRKNRVQLQ